MRYHYTVGSYLASILRDGLHPATAGVPKSERPIVWFTASPHWEETANKSLVVRGMCQFLTQAETSRFCDGLCRIGVRDDLRGLHPFARITRESHQDPRTTDALIAVAVERGSAPARDWYGTFRVVQPADFAVVEKFDGSGWVPVPTIYDALGVNGYTAVREPGAAFSTAGNKG
jgi:hypothetical protein